jgi:XTP/dITP diphosphohydrolase
VFRPEGLEIASAEHTPDEKNAQSHRARAFGALIGVLRARYG